MDPQLETVAPVFQEKVFVIMWKSPKRGGTYSEVRRSEQGKNRFVNALLYVGYEPEHITVIEQTKPWMAQRKTKKRKVQVDE